MIERDKWLLSICIAATALAVAVEASSPDAAESARKVIDLSDLGVYRESNCIYRMTRDIAAPGRRPRLRASVGGPSYGSIHHLTRVLRR
jgi:hypothetical protein